MELMHFWFGCLVGVSSTVFMLWLVGTVSGSYDVQGEPK